MGVLGQKSYRYHSVETDRSGLGRQSVSSLLRTDSLLPWKPTILKPALDFSLRINMVSVLSTILQVSFQVKYFPDVLWKASHHNCHMEGNYVALSIF